MAPPPGYASVSGSSSENMEKVKTSNESKNEKKSVNANLKITLWNMKKIN